MTSQFACMDVTATEQQFCSFQISNFIHIDVIARGRQHNRACQRYCDYRGLGQLRLSDMYFLNDWKTNRCLNKGYVVIGR